MAKSQWVVNVTEANFVREIVERSRQVPVIVDFWAPWCSPCRSLAPLLERIVDEQQGKVILAKVNTDENPGLARQFAAEGIPAVYAVKDGAIVDRFVGLLPEAQIRAFVSGLLPTAAENEAKDAASLEARDPSAAEKAYREALAAEPKLEKARVGLARVLLRSEGREKEALELIAGIEAGEFAEEAERLRSLIELRQTPHSDADLAEARNRLRPDDAPSLLALGRVQAARGDYVPALESLLAAAELDRDLGRTEIRETMVKIFRVLGQQNETVENYRRKLQRLLY